MMGTADRARGEEELPPCGYAANFSSRTASSTALTSAVAASTSSIYVPPSPPDGRSGEIISPEDGHLRGVRLLRDPEAPGRTRRVQGVDGHGRVGTDLLEVVYAVATLRGVDQQALEQRRARKAAERGGFEISCY